MGESWVTNGTEFPVGPTTQDCCAEGGHVYYGDDSTPEVGSDFAVVVGRCYCGQRIYPEGGPEAPLSGRFAQGGPADGA